MTKKELEKEAERYINGKQKPLTKYDLIAFAQKHIIEFEKENAELKKELVEKGQHLDLTEREWGRDTTKLIHYKTQSAKAKEIIRDFISVAIDYIDKEDKNYSYIIEAEQFLKETEE